MIYLDNAATTAMYPECGEDLIKYSSLDFFNPSAPYAKSIALKTKIESIRKEFLESLHAPDGEIIFTSSGTEADNMALFGAKKWKNAKIIVSEGEHSAVYNSAKALKERGCNVNFAPIDKGGAVNMEKLAELLDEDVALVSVMHASNETGAINDISEISRLVRIYSPKAVIHSDGVQAYLKMPVNLRLLDVDLYTISGHKFHAPKGVGALYIKKGVRIRPVLYGGGQEMGLRSSTENVGAICALSTANAIGNANFDKNYSKKRDLVEYFRLKLIDALPTAQIISPQNSIPNILSVAFENIRGEVLLHILEKDGILVGIGSACSSNKESRFKKLFKLDEGHSEGIVRFSFSEFNNKSELDFVVEKIVLAMHEFGEFKRK